MDTPKYGTPEWDAYVADERQRLESKVGQVWDTNELTSDFSIDSFMAPFCFGRRKADNAKVSILFQHSPRFYYSVKES